ncbi:inosine/xanthosine triphosphatase [Halogranum amylolyticum]|uniref:inosine/xanthosine triphosphatase n=1 Tax=Halogranum amylolyticum TaxID=660520 RepID=A0A1H8PM04_9EURY|nr:inosine/xanthosine triphosphatase [Halogranum amylolyticum]SEO43049.1 inosine/xanthosine triphosphatase [Halogranum amylolyticum]
MHIGVGSGNPAKRRAVERTLPEATVTAVGVDSGVSEQPTGHAETVRGAENRARNVLATDEFDYGVGLEGGVATFDGTDGLFLIMWAAVTDGETVGRGAGPSLELPADVAARVSDGAELGPVMDDVLGTTDVAKKAGAAGALSGGRVDRAAALGAALAGAFGPFETDLYGADG